MRISEGGTNLTVRNQYIRMCIAKTLIQLMETKDFDDITITELVKRASVSRMTFYKYYKSKHEVLADYMYEIVNEYVEDIRQRNDIGKVHELKRICHCLEFFKGYSHLIITLVNANMYSVIIDAVNNYMDTYVVPESHYSRYELYYYAGALCNIFIKWLESGMEESPEKIAEMVHGHFA
ncbi:TetR/AcrR family transcriptional regulator [Niameybacter massiliensis]|uniref:TetR/AcrR family transcriptional regulator n=1 Tax=Holtiella tumoricola TaxID=3018743 RepID=A0AA42DL97_9FIRM|nr:TetR/AcrR family transcriptional regulator [Holtiella tumoricola]MDA3731175.1 TetR/AcrR family transcriptional regulator [Holtiella tumoricola]